MVTVGDADSLFDAVFLDQLEGEFWRMPNGRRCIYHSPINTYRNFPECSLPTQIIEVMRYQGDVFAGQAFRPAQSNYFLTLGFAQEINYWDPTNTTEGHAHHAQGHGFYGHQKRSSTSLVFDIERFCGRLS